MDNFKCMPNGAKNQGVRSIATTEEKENASSLCKEIVILSKDHQNLYCSCHAMQMKAFYLIFIGSCLSLRVLFSAVTKKPVQSYFENRCHTSTHVHTLCPFTSSRGHTLHLGNMTSF